MKVKFIKYMIHVIMVLVCTCLSTPCGANVTFTNFGTSFLLNATNSKLYVNNPAKVTGWGQHSIVKAYGDIASSSWPEGYAAGSIVGQTGASSVTKPTRTNLVDANSNAINTIGGNLLRTTSNLLLYTARTYSSSLFVVRSRADSSSRDIRTTSNAVNMFYNNLSVPTTDSIDGTQFMRYHTAHHVFHNNGNAWTIRGWVRFNDGFTVMPLGSVIMDTLTTVSGGFDLRDTGTLILNNDLYLAHNVTLTNGGNIKGRSSSIGQANTIFMGGDLTLSETTYARTLHITGDWSNSGTSGDLIIDGCGNTLNIGDRAQIFVDQNITLTLRNMTIKTGPKSLNNPAIQLAAHGSKLALDNVMFDLGADFHFINGQIFVHNEVAVTGTSAFVYQSPRTSYITSGATWSFEQGTTFSVAPSTFTDCPFTVNNTYTNNAFLVLADASSALSLNGCSLQTTFTGLRLRSGMVLFDNKVAIDTTAGVDLNNTTPLTEIGSGVSTGNSAFSVSWSPDSHFIAVISNGAQTLQVFRFNGTSIPTQSWTVSIPGNPQQVAWSPDGRFIAVANYGGSLPQQNIQIFRFTGASTPTLVTLLPEQPGSISWSPDSRFIATLDTVNNYLKIFRFNGVSRPVQIGINVTTDTEPRRVTWSPDGRFLAVAHSGSQSLRVYRFNGNSTPSLVDGAINPGNRTYDVQWSPDGRYLFLSVYTGGFWLIYRFNGKNKPMYETGNGSGSAHSTPWSPDGRFFVVDNYASSSLQIYRFNGITTSTVGSAISVGSQLYATSWSPDGQFIAAVNSTSPGTLHIFRCNYYYTGQPTQGFSNGLVFGDKAKGAAYDADVQVLGNATVAIKGMVRDDSA